MNDTRNTNYRRSISLLRYINHINQGEEEMNMLQIKQLSPDATLPTREHSTDAGLDIYAAENEIIRNNETKVIKTGIAINIPEGYEATIRPRSGKTSKTALRVQIGTIDAGYNGPIGVICDCHIQAPYFHVQKGDKIAQLVISPIVTPQLAIVDQFDTQSARGDKGFGSSDND